MELRDLVPPIFVTDRRVSLRDRSLCGACCLMLALGLSNLDAGIQSRKPGLKGLGVATQPFLYGHCYSVSHQTRARNHPMIARIVAHLELGECDKLAATI